MYATDMMDPTENGDTANTPFYEKLVTEEVQELKAYSRMMEVQKQRVEEVEDLQKDLESRLQSETAARQKLETILALREREWSRRLESSEQDRQRLRQQIKEQEAKNQRISEIVLRKEQEIQRMVRRKYDDGNQRVRPTVRSPLQHAPDRKQPPERKTPAAARSFDGKEAFPSPFAAFEATGSAGAVRVRETNNLLLDFFGM